MNLAGTAQIKVQADAIGYRTFKLDSGLKCSGKCKAKVCYLEFEIRWSPFVARNDDTTAIRKIIHGAMMLVLF